MNLLELQRENEALKDQARKCKFAKVIDLICENGELKEENETLRLRLFWKEYGQTELSAAMRLANFIEGGPQCSCLACAVSGRHKSECGGTDENKPCTFKSWFEQMIRDHNMSIGYGIPDEPIWVTGGVCGSRNKVLDDDKHFTILGREDWSHWTYGSRLWKATSVLDPELAKLESLFKTLDKVGWEDTEE